ncbi:MULTISPECIES: DUF6795 domain-containing protein [Pseudoalteromonas]|uniref:DUF6795 domain-containing protein n=1 Tax=Pseudoalteromonas TaxID=53246 RepID=UPI0015841D37|nr:MULTISPECIES: DUF6795 domain-containing protein [Pseudoalteromonas]MDI4652471.1 hypothetical protein [Pseudoalteromonas shioyasakiensis]NUJ38562.1 hypothetical protein [Pseudoalteromonas sp. 0303]
MFGLFKKYDVHLCPEVRGRILDNGIPVIGLTVQRWLGYTDEVEREDLTTTDESGHFYFPEYNIRSKLPGRLFVENITHQAIYIDYKNKRLPLWQAILEGREPIAAFNIKLNSLNCDLKSEIVDFEFKHANPNRMHCARSICRWSSDFSIY